MLDQLFNIVKQFGQDTVVNNQEVPNEYNQEVPNEYNQEVMADATTTIASGLQNIMAGGGFQNILDLFKGGGNTSGNGSGGGMSSLLKNPIVIMMVGYFIKKLISKYSMSPSTANNVANNLIPNALNGLIQQTNDPNNSKITLDGLIGSLTGGGGSQQEQTGGGSQLQDILDRFTGGGSNGNGNSGFNIQDIISNLTQKAQNTFQDSKQGGGGIMDIIKGLIN